MILKTLFQKEMKQHFLVLLIFCLLGYAALIINSFVRNSLSNTFETLRIFIILFVTISAFILSNQLIAREYNAKTQLFLESLPLTRFRMVLVKYVIGLFIMLGIIALSLIITFSYLAIQGKTDIHIISNIIIKTMGFSLVVYAFFFLFGFLGRYRIPLAIILIFGIMLINSNTTFEFLRFGPVSLVANTFGYERYTIPWSELVQSFVSFGIFSLTAFGLALVREGDITEHISSKMSQREKIFLSITIIGILFIIITMEEKKSKEAFKLVDSYNFEYGSVNIKMTFTDTLSRGAGKKLCEYSAKELNHVSDFLGLSYVPDIFLIERLDLDTDQYEKGKINKAEGVLFRINFNHNDWDSLQFLSELIKEIIINYSDERVLLERNKWIIDGFPNYWLSRNYDSGKNTLWLRAAAGKKLLNSKLELKKWNLVKKKVGEDVSNSIAWSLFKILEQRVDSTAFQKFLSLTLAKRIPKDFRAILFYKEYYCDNLMPDLFKIDHSDLELWLTDSLDQYINKYEAKLDSIPRVSVILEQDSISDYSRKIRYKVIADDGSFDFSNHIKFSYGELYNLNISKPEEDLKSEYFEYAGGKDRDLPDLYRPGDRLYYSATTYSELLQCDICSGWHIFEVK